MKYIDKIVKKIICILFWHDIILHYICSHFHILLIKIKTST